MVRTSSDSLAGRGFVGRICIGQGDIVLQIKPEVYAPCWPCDVSELEEVERSVICNDTGAGETFVGSIDGAVVNDEALWTAGELQAHWLLAIRCALKLVPPSSVPSPSPPSATAACTLTALLELEDHGEIRPAASQRAIRNAAERLSSALHRGASLTLAPPDAERLFGVLLTNSFGLRGSGDGTGMEGGLDMRPHALALSLTAAMFNHSCHPNVHTDHRVTGADGVLTFRALRPIAEGTECTIAYVTTEEPTYWRQRALRRSKLFTCRCCVCADPTDGERFGGSFVCTSCGRGWQRQPPPSLSSAASPDAGMVEDDWQCTACGAVRPHAEIIRWDDEQRARLERCLQPSADGDGRAAGQVGARLRRLLCDLQAACHPNHAMLLQARLALVCFGFDDEDEGAHEDRRLREKLAAAEAALQLAWRVLPHPDAQKADLYFQIGLAQHGLARAASASRPSERAAASQLMRAAAESMLRSASQFGAILSEGAGSRPAKAAKEFAQLCMRQVAHERHVVSSSAWSKWRGALHEKRDQRP